MRVRLLACLSALLFFLPMLPAKALPPPPQPVLRALLLACDEFVTQPATTPSSYNNLINLRQALLRDSRGYQSIRVSLNQPLNAEGFAQLVQQAFAGAKEGDLNLFYLSTHGVQTALSSDFYALLSDGEEESLLSGADIHRALAGIPGTKLLIIDACYSGALINKGMDSPLSSSLFSGPDFKVLTSAGGKEPSFLWTDGAGTVQGGSFFARALNEGISSQGRYAADSNRDGQITMTELHSHLLSAYGASTPQAYPQRDDLVVLAYDVNNIPNRPYAVTDLSLENAVITDPEEELAFSYTLNQPMRLAYQLVYEHQGSWRFAQPQSIPEPGRWDGLVLPGRKAAALRVQHSLAPLSGYVLLLLVTVQEDRASPEACVLLSVQTKTADPAPRLEGVESFVPSLGQEAAFILRHHGAVSYSAHIINEEGQAVATLASMAMSRPLHLMEEGSGLWWDGRQTDGQLAPAGHYRLRVNLFSGFGRQSLVGEPFELIEPNL